MSVPRTKQRTALTMSVPRTKHEKHGMFRAIPCCIILLVLPSCIIPELRQAVPGPGLPESFNGATSAGNSSLLGIEEFYHDPRLTFLIDSALAGNRELKILEQEVRIASNEILARSGAYLPFLTLGAGAGLARESNRTIEGAAIRDDEFAPGRFFSNPHGTYQTGFGFTWQLDIYRQLRNARDAAGLRYEAAIERRNYFVTTLVAEIAETYYRLMAFDKRIENLNQIIELQGKSLEIAKASKKFAEGTELGVLRFEASIRSNQSQRLIVNQDIIEAENRINFLLTRFPQAVERDSTGFFDLNINALDVGVPSQLLLNRPDVRQAERTLTAAGLDVKVARVNFYPQLIINASTSLEAFNISDLFNPQAVAGHIAGGLVGPFVNFRLIKAQYLTANAEQLRAIYDYQRIVLNAFTEVVNRLYRVRNFSNSVALRKQQITTLEAAVNVAEILFQNARTEYLDVLTAQQDLRDARVALIDTKEQQLTAVVNAYQALGGGDLLGNSPRAAVLARLPYIHTVSSGENFWTICQQYYKSGRYYKALWAANQTTVPTPDRLAVGDKILIPWIDELDPNLIENVDAPAPPLPEALPAAEPASLPPPSDLPGPFVSAEKKDPAVGVAANETNPPVESPKPAATGEQPGNRFGSVPGRFWKPGSSAFRDGSQTPVPVKARLGSGWRLWDRRLFEP